MFRSSYPLGENSSQSVEKVENGKNVVELATSTDLNDDISPSTISIDSDDQLTNFHDDPFFSSLFSDLDSHSDDNQVSDTTSEGEEVLLRNLPSPPIDLDDDSEGEVSSEDDDPLNEFGVTDFGPPPGSMYRNHSLELPPGENTTGRDEEKKQNTVDIYFTSPFDGLSASSKNPQDDVAGFRQSDQYRQGKNNSRGGQGKHIKREVVLDGSKKQKKTKSSTKRRIGQPAEGKGGDALFDAPTPTIQETLNFFKSLKSVWQPKPEPLRVFCDYIRAAAINAKKNKKRLKKGDTIHRALSLSFGESLYQRGGGVKPGSSSDSISKLFHFITRSNRVKRKRKRSNGNEYVKRECDLDNPAKKRPLRKLLPRRPMIPMILPGGVTIPPALIFVAAPILFVCFIAYGHSSPSYNNAHHIAKQGIGQSPVSPVSYAAAAGTKGTKRSFRGARELVGPPIASKATIKTHKEINKGSTVGQGHQYLHHAKSRVGKANQAKGHEQNILPPHIFKATIKNYNGGSGSGSYNSVGSGSGVSSTTHTVRKKPATAPSLLKEPKERLRNSLKRAQHKVNRGHGRGDPGKEPTNNVHIGAAGSSLPPLLFASSTGFGGTGATGSTHQRGRRKGSVGA